MGEKGREKELGVGGETTGVGNERSGRGGRRVEF